MREDEVDLQDESTLLRAASVGVARRYAARSDPSGARPTSVAKLAGAANDLPGLPDSDLDRARLRVDGHIERLIRADQVHLALGKHQVIPSDGVGIARPVRDLDDRSDTGEHASGDDQAAGYSPSPRFARCDKHASE